MLRGSAKTASFGSERTLTAFRAHFEVDGAIEEDREARRPIHLVLKKLARALEEFTTYIDDNASGIVNYGERGDSAWKP